MPKSLVPNTFDYSGIYVEGQRNYFRFHKPHAASFMSGMLVPLGDPIPCFPGVKAELLIDAVIRSNTMLVPPLDGMYIDFFTVWVPHRIVFEKMPQFLGENDTTAWTQSVEVVYPTVYLQTITGGLVDLIGDSSIQGDVVAANNFLNVHYGLATDESITSSKAGYNVKINVLAQRGYYAIWNHFFRDENYQRPVLFSKGTTGSNGEFGYLVRDYNVSSGMTLNDYILSEFDDEVDADYEDIGSPLHVQHALLMPVNKFHDWATSLLPQAQFGSAVELSLGDTADVKLKTALVEGLAGNGQTMLYVDRDPFEDEPVYATSGGFLSDDGGAQIWMNPNGSLYADLASATAITINQLRSAVMLQRYKEALGRGGRRVVEYYANIYNVKNSVAAKDYPVMMSHQRYPLGVNQVVATADASGSGWTSHLGDTGAYSLSVFRNIPCCKGELTEFGYLHILYCVRADNRYSQALPKHFTYVNLLDEYNPYFDHIGDVDMPNYLVNMIAKTSGNFGFQEAWWEERSQQGLTVGALNKKYGSLAHWVLGESFDLNLVTCTPGYLCFNPAVFNDVFVSAYYVYPQFIIDALIHGRTAKRMSLHSIPGISGRI